MPDPKIRAWSYSLPAAILLLAPFDIMASLAMDIYLPVVPIMPGALGTSPAVVQLTLSLYMAVLGVGQIAFGPLSDRIGRRPVLIGGGLLFAGASLLLAASASAAAFIALRLLQAAGASAALVALFATVRDVYAERPEGVTIYGLLGSILALVPAIGPVAGAVVANCLGWRAIFVALSALAAAATFNAVWRWPETAPFKASDLRASCRSVLTSLAFWAYTFSCGTAFGAFFVFVSIAPRVLIDRAGTSPLTFSFAFATVALVMMSAARFASRFVATWGVKGCVMRGMVMLLVSAALLAAGQLTSDPSFWTFIVPMWPAAVGIVLTTSVTAEGALRDFNDIAGTAVALYFCIQSLIVVAAGTLFVMLLPGDTAWPLIGFSSTMALMTLFVLTYLHRSRSTPAAG